ncbi:MAG: ABC transporter ATP-binding protein [Flavobacteriales bacterium]|nr:ABC transporter ATP-binding protein [Flavobacteriales bacterium]MBP9080519.1 ABC transporter ATP-binding protein [Flavobacteriales bacterium]
MRSLVTVLPYFGRYWGRMALGFLFIALTGLFTVYTPQVVREAFNLIGEGITQLNLPVDQRHLTVSQRLVSWTSWTGLDLQARLDGPLDDASLKAKVLWFAIFHAGLFLVFTVLSGFFLFLTRQTIIVVSRLIEYDLKNAVFAHYQELDRAFYKHNSTGDLMNRISEDVGKVRQFIGPAVMYITNLVALTVMIVWVMMDVNMELTLWSLAPLPLLSVAIYMVSETINQRSMATQQQQSRLSTMAQESFSGIRVVKAYAKEAHVEARFRQVAKDYRRTSLAQAKVDALFMPAIMLLVGLSTTLVIFVGGILLIQGDNGVTVGNLAEFTLYVTKLTWPYASLGMITSQVQQAAVSMERINEFLGTRPAIGTEQDRLPEVKGAITFSKVGFTYPETGIEALKDVSFHVPAGGSLAIVGHTGSGKSTVVDLIGRQYDPTAGEVLLDGVPLREVALEKLRSNMGVVPQDVFLFSGTIADNIAFSLDPAPDVQQRVEQAARTAQLHPDISRFPKGYDTMLGERGITLSGGQKQRVSIARAVVRKPRILIFDDPLSAVDTATEDAILTGLRSVMKGCTTVIISHRISAVQAADHILVLEHGRIMEEGTHQQLLDRAGRYATLYEEQLLEEADQG